MLGLMTSERQKKRKNQVACVINIQVAFLLKDSSYDIKMLDASKHLGVL